MVNPGDTTPVHGLQAPQEYSNFVSEYMDLLDKVDAGLVLFRDRATLDSMIDPSFPDDVLAVDLTNNQILRSEAGAWVEVSASIDLATLEDKFVNASGDMMQGDLNMNNNDIVNGSRVESDTVEATGSLILPNSFG